VKTAVKRLEIKDLCFFSLSMSLDIIDKQFEISPNCVAMVVLRFQENVHFFDEKLFTFQIRKKKKASS